MTKYVIVVYHELLDLTEERKKLMTKYVGDKKKQSESGPPLPWLLFTIYHYN